MWARWGHMTIWKIYISTVTKLMVSKPCKRFSRQTFKSSPTSCFCSFFSSAVFLDGPMEVLYIYLLDYYVGSSDQYYWTCWRESNKWSINSKFRLWEHYMSCALEKIIIAEVSRPIQLSRFSTSWIFSHEATFFAATIFDNGKYKKHATNKIRSSRPDVFWNNVFVDI